MPPLSFSLAGGPIPFSIQPAGPPPDYVSPELVEMIQENAPEQLDLVDPTTIPFLHRNPAFDFHFDQPTASRINRGSDAPLERAPRRAVERNEYSGGRSTGREEQARKVEALLAKIQERNSRIAVRKAAAEAAQEDRQWAAERGGIHTDGPVGAFPEEGHGGPYVSDRVRQPDGSVNNRRNGRSESGGRKSEGGRSRSAPHQRPVSRGGGEVIGWQSRASLDDSDVARRRSVDAALEMSRKREVGGKRSSLDDSRITRSDAGGRHLGARRLGSRDGDRFELVPNGRIVGTRGRPESAIGARKPVQKSGVKVTEKHGPEVPASTRISAALAEPHFGHGITSPTLSAWSQDETIALRGEQSWLYSAENHVHGVNTGSLESIEGFQPGQEGGPVGPAAQKVGSAILGDDRFKQGLADRSHAGGEGPAAAGVDQSEVRFLGGFEGSRVEQGLAERDEGSTLASPLVQTFALGAITPAESGALENKVGLEMWALETQVGSATKVGPALVGGRLAPDARPSTAAGLTAGAVLSEIQKTAKERVRSALAKRPRSAASSRSPKRPNPPKPLAGARSHPFLAAPASSPGVHVRRQSLPGGDKNRDERRKSASGAELAGRRRPASARIQSTGAAERDAKEGKPKSRLSGERLEEVS
jgi:hypothetical protein